ncbi:TetR/AcrR family transcriptional regulator [Mycobacterium sp. MUNTM1]
MVDRSAERALILDTAYRLLDRSDGAVLEVTQILNETGLGTRAFYRHFKTRDELMLVMLRRDRDHVLEQLRDVVAAASDPVEALRRWVDVMFSLLSEPRRKRRVLTFHSEEMQRTRGYLRELGRFSAAEQAILAQVISEGKVNGCFPSADPGPDARSVRAVIEAALLEQAEHPTGTSADETAQQALRFVLRALGYAPASEATAAKVKT